MSVTVSVWKVLNVPASFPFSGVVGIELKPDWMIPANENDPGDATAAEENQEFSFGLFGDPVFKGDYSETVKQRGKTNLRLLTDDDKKMLKGEKSSGEGNMKRWEKIIVS